MSLIPERPGWRGRVLGRKWRQSRGRRAVRRGKALISGGLHKSQENTVANRGFSEQPFGEREAVRLIAAFVCNVIG